jgi:DNA mismatch endonuclease, patch repair protein
VVPSEPRAFRKSNAQKLCRPSAERSALMSRVRQRGTLPEERVQNILRSLGMRLSLNSRSLPGSPDIVVQGKKLAIFVHGCFWHRHVGCPAASFPRVNKPFWKTKFSNNISRDRRKTRQLRKLGFSVAIIWECQVKTSERMARVRNRFARFS